MSIGELLAGLTTLSLWVYVSLSLKELFKASAWTFAAPKKTL